MLLHGLHDHLGRGVGPGAEGQARIQDHLFPVRFIAVRQPVGEDHQRFPYLLRGIVVLPALLPVGLRQGSDGDGQMLFLGEGFQHRQPVLLAVLQVELYPAEALELLFQVLVDIVPIFPVLLQEGLKLLLILNAQIRKPQPRQGRRQGVYASLGRIQGNFQPRHGGILLFTILFAYFTTNCGKIQPKGDELFENAGGVIYIIPVFTACPPVFHRSYPHCPQVFPQPV